MAVWLSGIITEIVTGTMLIGQYFANNQARQVRVCLYLCGPLCVSAGVHVFRRD